MVSRNAPKPTKEITPFDEMLQSLTSISEGMIAAFDPDQLDDFASRLRDLAKSVSETARVMREFKATRLAEDA